MQEKGNKIYLNSFALHIIAMSLMLCDHLWATIIPGQEWLTCLGRIAFPIFAFMTVEGFFKTHNKRKHIQRLFVFAIISELPFNLMLGGQLFYPFHQNVLWTFWIASLLMLWNEHVKEKKMWVKIIIAVISVLGGSIIGLITMIDYHAIGIPTVLMFYFLRKKNTINCLLQIIFMFIMNVEIIGGLEYSVEILSREFFISQQGFAMIALIPIWLYNGKQGPYNKTIKNIYYWFYPVHSLVLGLCNFL